MTFKINPAHATDSYKLGHRMMYPIGTGLVYSNLTPRSGRIFKANVPEQFWDSKIVAYGLQGLVKHMHELWQEEFFDKPKKEVVEEYSRRIAPFVGASAPDASGIAALHDLGKLPLLIKGLPEGSLVDFGIPVFTVQNTHPDFFWLTNYIETYLSNEYWKVSTAATIARVYRKILEHFAMITGSPEAFIDWQAHDFSCRGMSGMYDSAVTGSGHLTSFTGTDTLVAVDYVEYAYDGKGTFVGGSVPASEHSVMTMGGPEGEYDLFKRLVTEVYPSGIVSLVSDSYDFWKVITEYSKDLKPFIMQRKPDAFGNAKVVFRPDSGDPVDILCGTSTEVYSSIEEAVECINELHMKQANEDCEGSYCVGMHEYVTIAKVGDSYYEFTTPMEYNRHDKTYYYVDNYGDAGKTKFKEITATPEMKGAVECLWEIYGGTITSTGHKLLDSHVGLIYGDSITMQRAVQIMQRLHDKGFASANVVLGIGSYTYNYLTRDVLGSAVKATYGEVNGVGREIFKAPKTDNGTKHSAKGLLKVEQQVDGSFKLLQQVTFDEEANSALVKYYDHGAICSAYTFDEIRKRIRQG